MRTLKLSLLQTLKEQTVLLMLAAFGTALMLVRVKITHSPFYFFLVWNLFLAYTPLMVATWLENNPVLLTKNKYFYPLALAWLLLLPNAPYIITDFVHLNKHPQVPVWFDVLLLISFSLSGLLFGLASMKKMFLLLSVKFTPFLSWLLMALVCPLCGFGVYLGRELRYNSWDILHRPLNLLHTMATSLTDAETFRTAWGFTLGFGCFLFLLFHLFCTTDNQKNL